MLLRHIKSILLLKGKLTFIIKNAQKSYVHHRQISSYCYHSSKGSSYFWHLLTVNEFKILQKKKPVSALSNVQLCVDVVRKQ